MTTTVSIKEITIDNEIVTLVLMNQVPHVIWKNETYSNLWSLVEKLKNLSDQNYIYSFADISNFLWKGKDFKRIESIEGFKDQYRNQVELERRNPSDVYLYRLTDYKIFDVSVIHEPRIDKNHLIYYVFNINNGLPYRVVCPFPYPKTSTQIHYQILPVL
jgi:hypothetical protein